MITKKHRKVAPALICIEQLLILVSMVTECVSIFAFDFLVGIRKGITSSAVGLEILAVTAGIKEYKSIIMKKRKKHDKVVSLPETC